MKTGLFGGTFDPIHNGHLKVALTAKNQLGLDRIIFIPSGNPPHKTDKKVTDKERRLAMTRLAVKETGALVSDWEVRQENKSYSVDLVRHFMQESPDDEFYFIIGADSFYDLPTWYHYRDLMDICRFVVISRPDTEKSQMLDLFEGTEKPPRVLFLDDLNLDISSTQIRRMLGEGKDVSHLVPKPVLDYIKNQNLYKHCNE